MTDDKPDEEEKPSRSARKRFAADLQDLGKELLKLRADQLELIPIQDKLSKAIGEYHRIRSNEAKRRQAQYVGRLMRDEDHLEITKALENLTRSSASAKFEHHQLEEWRDRLLTEPGALTQYLESYPNSDIQKLRTLIRQTQNAKSSDKKHPRLLFRLLRENQQNLTEL